MNAVWRKKRKACASRTEGLSELHRNVFVEDNLRKEINTISLERWDHQFQQISRFDSSRLLPLLSPRLSTNSYYSKSFLVCLRVGQILHQDMNDHHLMSITKPMMIHNVFV